MVAQQNGGDGMKVVSPVEGVVKKDSLDEGSASGTLSGLELFEVDTVSDFWGRLAFLDNAKGG